MENRFGEFRHSFGLVKIDEIETRIFAKICAPAIFRFVWWNRPLGWWLHLLVQNVLPFVADEVEGEVTSGVVRRDPDYKKTVSKKLDYLIK